MEFSTQREMKEQLIVFWILHSIQHAANGQWTRTETERSNIIVKNANKRIQLVDNCLIADQPQRHRRHNEDPVDTLDKERDE